MKPTLLILLLLTLPILLASNLTRADTPIPPPDPAATRDQINALIATFQSQKKPPTLGLLCQSIDLSISIGAPVWNQGDHLACCQFYTKTIESLTTAFPDNSPATPLAALALADLKSALNRTRNSTDTDRNAWALRYAFDKTELSMSVETVRATGALELGQQCLRRGEFIEAQDAFQTAANVLHEMDGLPPEKLSVVCRYAPFALANALFGQKKYAQAADTILLGLQALPQLPTLKQDLRASFDRETYENLMDDLKAQAVLAPNNASLQFLVGYYCYFSGRKTAALEHFQNTLKIDPNHIGAKLFLSPPAPSNPEKNPPELPHPPAPPKTEA